MFKFIDLTEKMTTPAAVKKSKYMKNINIANSNIKFKLFIYRNLTELVLPQCSGLITTKFTSDFNGCKCNLEDVN